MTQHDKTYLVGLCSGLFAATAIASTPSLSTLVPIAVQVVLMAFRTGSYVHTLAERLSPTFETSESWTYVLPNSTGDEVATKITDFHNQQVSITQPSNAFLPRTVDANP